MISSEEKKFISHIIDIINDNDTIEKLISNRVYLFHKLYDDNIELIKYIKENDVIQKNLESIINYINNENVNDIDEKGNTLLHLICNTPYIPGTNLIINKLVECGSILNMFNEEGFTPLMNICTNRDIDIELFKNLINLGFDPNIGTPLIELCRKSATKDTYNIFEYLLDKLNIEKRNRNGENALIVSVFNPNWTRTNDDVELSNKISTKLIDLYSNIDYKINNIEGVYERSISMKNNFITNYISRRKTKKSFTNWISEMK